MVGVQADQSKRAVQDRTYWMTQLLSQVGLRGGHHDHHHAAPAPTHRKQPGHPRHCALFQGACCDPLCCRAEDGLLHSTPRLPPSP